MRILLSLIVYLAAVLVLVFGNNLEMCILGRWIVHLAAVALLRFKAWVYVWRIWDAVFFRFFRNTFKLCEVHRSCLPVDGNLDSAACFHILQFVRKLLDAIVEYRVLDNLVCPQVNEKLQFQRMPCHRLVILKAVLEWLLLCSHAA